MSIQLTLKANNATETRVLEYLQANASDALAEKINTGTKTLTGCLDYAKDEARKLAKGEPCLCVGDATVFGWIIHYFEEDDVKEKAKRQPVTLARPTAKPTPKPDPKPEPKKAAKPEKNVGQMSLMEELFT